MYHSEIQRALKTWEREFHEHRPQMHSFGLKYQEATHSLCTTSGASVLTLLQKYWCLTLENCPGLALGCLVAQLCPTLWLWTSPPASSVYGIIPARVLEWVAISSSRDWTCVSCGSCVGGWILYHWDPWEILLWMLGLKSDLKDFRDRRWNSGLCSV